jgi:uncharacterized RmlC-like cupin family protein
MTHGHDTSHAHSESHLHPRPRTGAAVDWKTNGVKVVPGHALDPNTAQTPGSRKALGRDGDDPANAKTGAHHHGDLESIIFVVKGRARMRWGDNLEFTAEAGPGDFIYVPPYVPHQEINASRDEVLECVLVRSGQEPVVVNLDIAPVEPPELVLWQDPIHR